jgi:hypothetical protein
MPATEITQRAAAVPPPAPPAPPAPRARLVEAIARVSEAESELARVREARSRAPDTTDAMIEVDRAQAALAKAKAGEAAAMVTALLNGGAQNNDVALADRALRQATALYDRAKKVATLLDMEERSVEQALGLRRGRLRDAVAAVLKTEPQILRLLQEYRQCEYRLAQLGGCLRVIASAGGIPEPHRFWETPKFGRFAMPPNDEPDKSPAVDIWREAVADLADDAGAALPEV